MTKNKAFKALITKKNSSGDFCQVSQENTISSNASSFSKRICKSQMRGDDRLGVCDPIIPIEIPANSSLRKTG